MNRYSEPYSATGGLAAEGVINQLGRPDIEPLEVLVREAVQNCWDAKRATARSISVEVGRIVLDEEQLHFFQNEVLVSPPSGLPLEDELQPGLELLYFADYGTDGLGGPTRADAVAPIRDFVDFARNIGQPPDKDLGGGSFGYGKAAFYRASHARTILIDTLCVGASGELERRFMACALGENFEQDGRPHTGRHWWGELIDGVPEPLLNERASEVARGLGLPSRTDSSHLGTTIVVVSPRVNIEGEDGVDESMDFIAEALVWNFWPKLIDSPRAGQHTMEFRVLDRGRPVRIPNPRTHQRLRDFVEAMDRLREEPGEDDDDFILDRAVTALRPRRELGRVVVKKTLVSATEVSDRAVPVGARLTRDNVHHVALMRNAELVVRYMPGSVPSVARMGYAGVFKCTVDVDDAFRAAEPPTHDDWVYRAVSDPQERSFVKIGLERVMGICKEAAGYDSSATAVAVGLDVPLGEFADSMASLMPGSDGPGARRQSGTTRSRPKKRRSPGRASMSDETQSAWTESNAQAGWPSEENTRAASTDSASDPVASTRTRLPQLRAVDDPRPAIARDGTPVVQYPFELRTYGGEVRLDAVIEIMSSDGGQVESEAPAGARQPAVHAWIAPTGAEHELVPLDLLAGDNDGRWLLQVTLADDAMMRVDLKAERR